MTTLAPAKYSEILRNPGQRTGPQPTCCQNLQKMGPSAALNNCCLPPDDHIGAEASVTERVEMFFYILNFTKVYKMNIGSGRWQKLKKIKKRSFLSEDLNFWIIWPGSSQSSSRQQRTFQKDFFILKGQCFQVSSPQYLVWYGFDFANIFVSKARNVCSLYSTVC